MYKPPIFKKVNIISIILANLCFYKAKKSALS